MYDVYVAESPRRLALVPANVISRPETLPVLVFSLHAGHGSAQPSGAGGDAERNRAVCQFELHQHGAFRKASLPDYFAPVNRRPVAAIAGLIDVDGDMFLVAITASELAAEIISGKSIYRVLGVSFYSLKSARWDYPEDYMSPVATIPGVWDIEPRLTGSGYDASSAPIHPCAALERYLSSGRFYWEGGGDLTHSMMASPLTTTLMASPAAELNPDDRFLWNEFLADSLVSYYNSTTLEDRERLHKSGLMALLIHGYVEVFDYTPAGDSQVDLLRVGLLSRVGCKRAGARFYTRGMDDEGHVASYVESEVVVCTKELVISHVQVRGSVPLFWEQSGIQLGAHRVTMTRGAAATRPALQRHIEHELARYGSHLHILNLLADDAPGERSLSDAYKRQIQSLGLPRALLEYSAVDFNRIVASWGGSIDGVKDWISRGSIRTALEGFGFTAIDVSTGDAVLVQRQSGIIRTNCIDCLDRTNIMQSIVAELVLTGLIYPQCLKTWGSWSVKVIDRLANQWARNGDALAQIYAGSDAMKGGLLKPSGSITWKSLFGDAQKAVQRAVASNFTDKGKQDTIDLLLGKRYHQRRVNIWDSLLYTVQGQMKDRIEEYSTREPVRVFVGTYNVNGRGVSESLEPWLTSAKSLLSKPPQIYIIGLQEIVELTASQIVAADTEKCTQWEEHILAELNRRLSFSNPNNPYVLVRSGQLVGAALMVFARSTELGRIRNLELAMKKTGMGGMAGNKGGIATRFDWCDTSFCFVTAHLAAGQANVTDRNNDYDILTTGIVFSKGRLIHDHENVIWLGDFNYRIESNNEDVRARIARNDLESLSSQDQLAMEQEKGRVFVGYLEGVLSFPPTYKYDNGTDRYDTSEKQRIPAWTDRILYQGECLQQLLYTTAGQVRISDHRPILSVFLTEILIIDRAKKVEIQQQLMSQYRNTHQPNVDMTKGGHAATTTAPAIPPKPVRLVVQQSEFGTPPAIPPRKSQPSMPPPRRTAEIESTKPADMTAGGMSEMKKKPPPIPPRPKANMGSSTIAPTVAVPAVIVDPFTSDDGELARISTWQPLV